MRTGLLSLAILLMAVIGASGCPDCNIYNYLAPSVMSSSNIFIGKVVRRVDNHTVEAEVLEVLRGNYKPHDRVVTDMYRNAEAETNRCIFSDPTASPPTFEVLPTDFKDEVAFLVRGRPLSKDPYEYDNYAASALSLNPKLAATNLIEAIKCVQGVSFLTQQAGREFISTHQAETIQQLISELVALKPTVLSSNGPAFGQHRLAGLLDALLSAPSEVGSSYALGELKSFCAHPASAPDWIDVSRWPTEDGEFLKNLLAAAKQSSDLSNRLSHALLGAYPKLSGTQLSGATSALIVSGYETPSSLKGKLPADPGAADCYALGVYWAGVERARWWDWKKARSLFEGALESAQEPHLKAAIADGLKRCR